jgi:S-DNA-T family DNA segregation ATPase FtsK/SpoIIIE
MPNAIPYLEQQPMHDSSPPATNVLRESFNWITIGFGAYLLIALVTYTPHDSGWSYIGSPHTAIQNAGGALGAWCADILLYLFGYLAFLIPSIMMWRGIIIICYDDNSLFQRLLSFTWRLIGFLITIFSGTMLVELYIYDVQLPLSLPAGPGGVIGQFLTPLLLKHLLPLGSVLILATAFTIGITLLSNFSWLKLIDLIGAWICTIIYWLFWPILILIPKHNKTIPSDPTQIVTDESTSNNAIVNSPDNDILPITTNETSEALINDNQSMLTLEDQISSLTTEHNSQIQLNNTESQTNQ